MHLKEKQYVLVGLLLAVALALAACGGGGSSTGATSAEAGSETGSTEASGGADISAAEAAIAPYIGKANPPFPVDEPLGERPSPNAEISQLQFETPYGALIAQLIGEAGETAGVKVATTKAGNTAASVQSAAETILSQSPEAMVLPAAEPSIIAKQLKEIGEKGIKVFSAGVVEPAKWGIYASMVEDKQFEEMGKLLAAWTVAKRGDEANVVFYEVPELSFNVFLKEAFLKEMKALCAECEARTVPISVTEIGKDAPNTVVSDLQSHPGTNQVVLAAAEISQGLPAALKAAQIEVGIVALAGEPQTFEYIKNGEVEAVLATSAGLQAWTVMDMVLRAAQGQELTAGEKKGWTPMQFLAQKDITFDPSLGWASEPEFMKTFAKLWHAE